MTHPAQVLMGEREGASLPMAETVEMRVLILAPTFNDAELTAEFLARAGIRPKTCSGADELAERIGEGCGALVLAEESLEEDAVRTLAQALERQPAWSDLPITLITSEGDVAYEVLRQLGQFGVTANVTLLERPFRRRTLISTVDVALRSRQRQYQVRDLLVTTCEDAQKLRAESERFRLLAEAVPEKIFSSDTSGRVDYCNQCLLRYSGIREAAEWNWRAFAHPEDQAETIRRWQHTLCTGAPFEHEHRLRAQDGTYRWHLSRAHAMRPPRRGAWICIACCTDIEDRKQQEERLEQAVAKRTAELRETVEELEAFSYSISHDMRQPLRAMEGYAHALLEDYGPTLDREGHGYLDRIRHAAVRLDRLIQDVLSYSRVSRRKVELTAVDLSRMVRETMDTYPSLHDANIRVDEPLGFVRGHEAALVQCLSNLFGNALKFAAPGRPLVITLWTEVRPGGSVRLWIEDNGIGIRARDLGRVFDMFVQVHDRDQYPGTGIGLTIVRKAVERMGGQVGLESTFGKGSRFWIQLPSASK